MTADVRKVKRGREVCKMAKHGGTLTTNNRSRLCMGRPWQKVAVDLDPLPKTEKRTDESSS